MLCTRKSLNVLFNVTWDGFYSNQKIYWIDEEPLCTDDIESLMEEAEEFFETELENQEELYDEEEDN